MRGGHLITRLILVCTVMIMTVGASAAQAACTGVVAGRLGALRLVAAGPGEGVSITFLGHASFL
ncbi:MAG TPA: hypothetical protein VHT00_23760, partial [Stellaceae bacterium]|nr:hypothetical protein [Stellaceae bacterium]HEX3416531.1 hypothetical protein [Stellaceae bacterium]